MRACMHACVCVCVCVCVCFKEKALGRGEKEGKVYELGDLVPSALQPDKN